MHCLHLCGIKLNATTFVRHEDGESVSHLSSLIIPPSPYDHQLSPPSTTSSPTGCFQDGELVYFSVTCLYQLQTPKINICPCL